MPALFFRRNTGNIESHGCFQQNVEVMVRMLVLEDGLGIVRNHHICDLLKSSGCNVVGSRRILCVFLLSP